MRKGIFLMLLAIMCSAEAAEWVLVGENSPNGNIGVHYDTYANPSTIRKVGSRAQMWILFNNKTASVVNGRSFMSVKSQTEYDCKEEKSRALYYSFHVGGMGTGGLIFRNPDIGEWEPIAPDSISDSLWKVACEIGQINPSREGGLMAKWTFVTSSNNGTTYVDLAKTQRKDDLVKMWELNDFKTAKSLPLGRGDYLSSLSVSEYNCKEKNGRTLHLDVFSMSMANGKPLVSVSEPSEWHPVVLGTISESLLKTACGNK